MNTYSSRTSLISKKFFVNLLCDKEALHCYGGIAYNKRMPSRPSLLTGLLGPGQTHIIAKRCAPAFRTADNDSTVEEWQILNAYFPNFTAGLPKTDFITISV
jgi:hypothetical protein